MLLLLGCVAAVPAYALEPGRVRSHPHGRHQHEAVIRPVRRQHDRVIQASKIIDGHSSDHPLTALHQRVQPSSDADATSLEKVALGKGQAQPVADAVCDVDVATTQSQRKTAEGIWQESRVNGSSPSFVWMQHLRKAAGTSLCAVFQATGVVQAQHTYQNCMLADYEYLDLLSFRDATSLENAMLQKGQTRLVSQEYGPYPTKWAAPGGGMDNWVFVTSLRDPAKRIVSQLLYEYPDCGGAESLGALRECMVPYQSEKCEPNCGYPPYSRIGKSGQWRDFDYLDNYFVRVMSGNEFGKLEASDLECAKRRLHRFSLIWNVDEPGHEDLCDQTISTLATHMSSDLNVLHMPEVFKEQFRHLFNVEPTLPPAENVGRNTRHDFIRPEVLRQWCDRNKMDREFYQYAQQLTWMKYALAPQFRQEAVKPDGSMDQVRSQER